MELPAILPERLMRGLELFEKVNHVKLLKNALTQSNRRRVMLPERVTCAFCGGFRPWKVMECVFLDDGTTFTYFCVDRHCLQLYNERKSNEE